MLILSSQYRWRHWQSQRTSGLFMDTGPSQNKDMKYSLKYGWTLKSSLVSHNMQWKYITAIPVWLTPNMWNRLELTMQYKTSWTKVQRHPLEQLLEGKTEYCKKFPKGGYLTHPRFIIISVVHNYSKIPILCIWYIIPVTQDTCIWMSISSQDY